MIDSLLTCREHPALNPGCGALIVLHDKGGDIGQLVPLAQGAAPGMTILAAEGPRPVTAYTVEGADHFAGYAWYPGEGAQVTELARFGHALCCLEDLVLAYPRHWLLGLGQGAVMALTLACAMPDRLAGVIALGGSLPRAMGWAAPDGLLDGLPLLLAHDPDSDFPDDAGLLRARGGDVALAVTPGVCRNPLLALSPVRRWLARIPAFEEIVA